MFGGTANGVRLMNCVVGIGLWDCVWSVHAGLHLDNKHKRQTKHNVPQELLIIQLPTRYVDTVGRRGQVL